MIRGKCSETPDSQLPTRNPQDLAGPRHWARSAVVVTSAFLGSWRLGAGSWSLSAAQASQVAPSDPHVSFRIIVVSSADRATQMAERVKQGADFATLARTESLDPSAAQGGLIGPIALSELRADLQAVLRPLAPGAMSGVVQLPTGFTLVQRVEPRRRGRAFEETKFWRCRRRAASRPRSAWTGSLRQGPLSTTSTNLPTGTRVLSESATIDSKPWIE